MAIQLALFVRPPFWLLLRLCCAFTNPIINSCCHIVNYVITVYEQRVWANEVGRYLGSLGHTFWQLFDPLALNPYCDLGANQRDWIFSLPSYLPPTNMCIAIRCRMQFVWLRKQSIVKEWYLYIFLHLVSLHFSHSWIFTTSGQVGINTLKYIRYGLGKKRFYYLIMFWRIWKFAKWIIKFDGITNNGLLSYFITWLIIYHYNYYNQICRRFTTSNWTIYY